MTLLLVRSTTDTLPVWLLAVYSRVSSALTATPIGRPPTGIVPATVSEATSMIVTWLPVWLVT